MEHFRAKCLGRGLDVWHEFPTSLYNEHIAERGLTASLRNLSIGRGVLVGNTKVAWPHFLAWFRQTRKDHQDPFDTWCREVIEESVLEDQPLGVLEDQPLGILEDQPLGIYYSHEVGERLVSMARVASCSGLCVLDDATHLAIHPEYGSWISFRAVIVFPGSFDEGTLPTRRRERLENPLSGDRLLRVKALVDAATVASTCSTSHADVEKNSALWISIRDSVCTEEQLARHRFPDEMVAYHYCGDKSLLGGARLTEGEGGEEGGGGGGRRGPD